MQSVAVFDVDGTIFRSSLLIELVEVLIDRGIFDVSVREQYEAQKLEWLDREGNYEEYIMAVVHVFQENIRGVSEQMLVESAELVIERYRNRTYRYTIDLIHLLKERGYFLVAISHSPKEILDLFCGALGFDKVYGRMYELDQDGYYTGVITDEDVISNKANIFHRVMEKYDHLVIDGSVGVGDTEGDISFLQLVQNPICFNPNLKLYTYAQEHGWETVVERKDVIYELGK